MRTYLLGAAVALALTACGDDSSVHVGPGPDGGLDGSLPHIDGSTPDGSAPDAGDASVDAFVPPADPKSFTLEQAGSLCFGSCPMYTVSVDQNGSVHYQGEQCTARPGVFDLQVPSAQARALYDAFVQAKYWSFRDRYQDQSDGCPQVSTDGSTTAWDVVVEGTEKKVTRSSDCMGLPALQALDDLSQPFLQTTSVNGWVYGANDSDRIAHCGDPIAEGPDAGAPPVYLVSRGTQKLGIVGWNDARLWQLTTCSGANALSVTRSFNTQSGAVILGDAPLVFPEDGGTFGSIEITSGDAGVQAIGYTVTEDVPLALTADGGC